MHLTEKALLEALAYVMDSCSSSLWFEMYYLFLALGDLLSECFQNVIFSYNSLLISTKNTQMHSFKILVCSASVDDVVSSLNLTG